MKGIETWGVGVGRKEIKGTDRGTEDGAKGRGKGEGCCCQPIWTKLIHLKAKCPKSKNTELHKHSILITNSLQVRTKLLIFQGLYSS